MLPKDNLAETTRRAVLKAVGGALGVAALGSRVGAHEQKFTAGTDGYLGDNRADSAARTERVGFHTGGGVGPASFSGREQDAHEGAMTEFRIHDDLAFVTMFTSRSESSQVGLAIFDVSDFTRAESEADLGGAEPTLLSFVRNDNNAGAPIDCKVSDDGNYVFVCKQPLSALFGEAEDPQPNTDNHGASPGAASLDAIDVSDPGNPEVTDSVNISRWALGPHNCWYHQIGGDGYVFTAHGADGVTGSMNVFRFDHASGQLQQVNNWTWPGQDEATASGETGTFDTYAHDVVIQEDPKHGIPIAYLSYIDAGTRVLDVSDPMNIDELGVFEMEVSHHSVPTPALINGKRLMVCGQENPSDDEGATGFLHLVDADPIDEVIEGDRDQVYLGCSRFVVEKDGVEPFERPAYRMYSEDDLPDAQTDITPLDDWTLIGPETLNPNVDSPDGVGEGWRHAAGFEAEAQAVNDGEEEPGVYEGFGNFRISTHNLDADTDGRIYLGHYHAGSRFFEIVGPGDDFPAGPGTEGADVLGDARDEFDADLDWAEIDAAPGQTNDTDEWFLAETGYNRQGLDIPENATFVGPGEIDDGLTASTPFHWCLLGRNGFGFAGGINGGPQIYTHDDLEVGSDTPVDVSVERDHDSSVVTAGQTHRVTLRAEADEGVVLRDAVPSEWEVFEDFSPNEVKAHEIDGYRTIVNVELDETEDGVYEGTYVVSAPENEEGNNLGNTGSYTFGPVEYARGDGDGNADVDSDFGGGNSTTNRLWRKENGAITSINVVGVDTSL